MTLGIQVVRSGTAYSISDSTVSWIEAIEGLDNAPQHRIRERGPQQHGSTDKGYRLDERMIALALGINGASLSALDTLRQTLQGYFRPGTWATSLKFTLGGGAIRYIDGYGTTLTGAAFAQGMGFKQSIGVRFECADPTFYDPVEYSWQSAIGTSWAGGLVIPLTVPVSLALTGYTSTITYAGTWIAYPRMRLYGPIADWKIYNNSTSEKLDGASDTISNGSWYDFDCRYGYKTVTDNGGISQISKLSTDSDMATFHIATDPEVPGGVNSISVYGTGVGAATQLIIYYYVRYIGI